MSGDQRMIGPHNVDEWLKLPEPADGSMVELIYGHYHLTPRPTGQHQRASYKVANLLDDAVTAADANLHMAQGVAVNISAGWRMAFIPDVVLMHVPATGDVFPAGELALAVEVWSPDNARAERETKLAGYSAAGVPYLWTVSEEQPGKHSLTAFRLVGDRYQPEQLITAGGAGEVLASPVPVHVDLAAMGI